MTPAVKSGRSGASDAAPDGRPAVEHLCMPERLVVVESRIKNARIGPYGLFETLP